MSEYFPGAVDDDERGSLRLVLEDRGHPIREALAVGTDNAVGQTILDEARRQPGQGEVAIGHEVAHGALVRIYTREGEGYDDEGNRQHRPEEELELEATRESEKTVPHSGCPWCCVTG